MTCGLCKLPIKGDQAYSTDHYQCGVDLTNNFQADIDKLTAQRDRLRAALIGLIGVSTREELEQMEAFMRSAVAPAADKAASIDAIHALLEASA